MEEQQQYELPGWGNICIKAKTFHKELYFLVLSTRGHDLYFTWIQVTPRRYMAHFGSSSIKCFPLHFPSWTTVAPTNKPFYLSQVLVFGTPVHFQLPNSFSLRRKMSILQAKVTQILFIYLYMAFIVQMTWNLIFSRSGPKSDMYLMFPKAASVWTVRLHFIRLWHHSYATDATSLP